MTREIDKRSAGEGYLSMMRKNAETLQAALGQ